MKHISIFKQRTVPLLELCNQDGLTKPFAISEYYKTIIIIGGGVEPIADNLAGSSVRPSVLSLILMGQYGVAGQEGHNSNLLSGWDHGRIASCPF